ncbi:hypothetical protein [Lysobacter gummosus]|uniref:hypothetical protein n=1 Tax=Lysobacter gummosus TaxID=262324 RepID=UPI00362950B8
MQSSLSAIPVAGSRGAQALGSGTAATLASYVARRPHDCAVRSCRALLLWLCRSLRSSTWEPP